MVLVPGMLIGQNVRLRREIARGGMGSVWAAEHLTLRTEVAVKFMAAEIADREDAIARFTREATVAAQIKSQHVVQTIDHGKTETGQAYIVMEMLEGEDLGHRIEREGALPQRDVVTIVHQLCKVLGRAHGRGIVHRDIKPENIYLIDTEGDLFVKLLDFGVAKRNETPLHATWSGVTVGTPFYMSPEQVLSAKDVDFHTDLWSVAVVAYHALTGRVPFMAETVGGICIAIEKGVFPPPSGVRPELTAVIDAWFERAFAHDLTARFESAKALANAFEHTVLGTTPDSVPPPSSVDEPFVLSPRSPAVAALHDTPLEATITGSTSRVNLVSAGVAVALLGAAVAVVAMLTRVAPPVRTPAAALIYVAPTSANGTSMTLTGDSDATGVVVQPELQAGESASAPSAAPKPTTTAPPRRATIRSSVRRSYAYPQQAPTRRTQTAKSSKDRGF